MTYISKSGLDINNTYQELYKKARALINACMKFYNERDPLYLETDVSGVSLGEGLLQVRKGMILQATRCQLM